MFSNKKSSLINLFLGVSMLFVSSVSAHDIYIWPSYFSVNKEKLSSVAIDLTASYTPYRTDKALPSNALQLTNADGSQIRLKGGFYQGESRSVFDLPIKNKGTYGIAYKRKPSFYTTYKLKGEKKRQFKRFNKVEAKTKLPKGAFDTKSVVSTTNAIAFVTNKTPSTDAFKPLNKGLELIPVTHPADYITNEAISLKFLLDGKPVQGVQASIELEGAQYRKNSDVIEKVSNAQGKIDFKVNQGGRYMLKVSHKQPVNSMKGVIEYSMLLK